MTTTEHRPADAGELVDTTFVGESPVDLPDDPQEAVSSPERPDKAVAVVSGGMDSVAMLYRLHEERTKDIVMISFNYGQKHADMELGFANMHAKALGLFHYVYDMSSLGAMFTHAGSKSSLINPEAEVPEGHYAEDSMKATVVPNRNMIMSSIAVGLAVSAEANILALGVHSGDHFIYPDCRPEFFFSLEVAVQKGNEGFGHPKELEIWTPWMYRSKTDIVRDTYKYSSGYAAPRVDLRFTYSCYKGGEVHCGVCGTCNERKEAFSDASIPDPTIYIDSSPTTAAPESAGGYM